MLPSGISIHGYKSPKFNLDQKGDLVTNLLVTNSVFLMKTEKIFQFILFQQVAFLEKKKQKHILIW